MRNGLWTVQNEFKVCTVSTESDRFRIRTDRLVEVPCFFKENCLESLEKNLWYSDFWKRFSRNFQIESYLWKFWNSSNFLENGQRSQRENSIKAPFDKLVSIARVIQF